MAGKKWLESEIEFIKQNFKTMTCDEIGTVLNRTGRAVEHQSAKLNLIREPNIGDEFGRLKIRIKFFDEKKRRTYAICDCKCGKETTQPLTSLVQQRIVSCGCWKAEQASKRLKASNFRHGMTNTKLYRVWAQMRNRCFNPNDIAYKDYGGRGISVCDDWSDFVNFLEWSINNNYKLGLSIDRINNNGNYEPSNCRWATKQEQANNRRNNRLDTVKVSAFGETKAVRSWLQDIRCNVKSMTTIVYRIGAGWTPEDAISKPSERR